MRGSLLPCGAVGDGLAGRESEHVLAPCAPQPRMGLDLSSSTFCHPRSPEKLLCHLERNRHFLERVSNSASSKVSASPLNSAPYTEKSRPQVPFACLPLSFFPHFFFFFPILILSFPFSFFFYFLKRQTSPK